MRDDEEKLPIHHISDFILGRPSTPPFPHWLLLRLLFPLPSSLLYSSHSGNSFPFFSLEIPLSLSFPSVAGLLATDPVPPPSPLSPSLALTLAGGYANSSLSFLNWLIEARALWRPCLWAALFPLTLPSHNLRSCSLCIKRMHLLQWTIHPCGPSIKSL